MRHPGAAAHRGTASAEGLRSRIRLGLPMKCTPKQRDLLHHGASIASPSAIDACAEGSIRARSAEEYCDTRRHQTANTGASHIAPQSSRPSLRSTITPFAPSISRTRSINWETSPSSASFRDTVCSAREGLRGRMPVHSATRLEIQAARAHGSPGSAPLMAFNIMTRSPVVRVIAPI